MSNLRNRSYEKELMDAPFIPFDAMAQTLKELNFINTWLGGHAITRKGVRLLASGKKLTICEIGCGGGDNLQAIHTWCKRKGIEADFIGIDMNETCIQFAKQQYPQLPCTWICSDYSKVNFSNGYPHLIFSSLFCHHFTDEEMVSMLQWLTKNSQTGFFINDLHRHPVAFYLIKYLTKWFSRSELVRHDASLSVARGFTRKEWGVLFRNAGIRPPVIRWQWAFRWLVTSK